MPGGLDLKYGIHFATFDRDLPARLVARGPRAVEVIPVSGQFVFGTA